jgi:predicted dehydrogenase
MGTAKKRIAIVGYGLIGKQRFKAIKELSQRNQNVVCSGIYDPYIINNDAREYANIDEIIEDKPDLVVVAVPHNEIKDILIRLLDAGLNVLCEKPLGCNLKEAKHIIKHLQYEQQLSVGFNYRFYPAVQALFADIFDNKFGQIISVNMILGHGGSPDDIHSWRKDPMRCGESCLLDPGIHLLDLLLCMATVTEIVSYNSFKGFWNTGIDEECHLIVKCGSTIFNIQTSLVRWLNIFYIEVNGTEAYAIVEGRNGNYGPQKYRFGKRWSWKDGGKQRENESIYNFGDIEHSFVDELENLLYNTPSVLNTCKSDEAIEIMKLYQLCIGN